MRYKLLIVLITFIIQSCDNQPLVKQDKALRISMMNNAKIKDVKEPEQFERYSVEKGSNTVFILKNKGVTFKDGVDWEPSYEEELIFEVDSSTSKFEYKDKELEKLNAKYYWVLYSKIPEVKRVNLTTGTISGTKVSPDEWEISFKVDTGVSFGSSLNNKGTHKLEVKKKIRTSHL